MINSTLLIDSSSRPIKQWRAQGDLCDRSNRCNWGNTKIDSITREVTVGSLLRAVTGTMQVSTAFAVFLQEDILTYDRVHHIDSKSCQQR
jgi:hypothetical protein